VLDDEMLARGRDEEFHGRKLRMVSTEDLVIKAVVHDEHMPRHWHDALGVLARRELDWEYLLRRAAIHGARRVLSLLIYAQADDVAVPTGPIRVLFETVYRDWPETGPDRGEAGPDGGEAGPDR
jgi:hypothetical protein